MIPVSENQVIYSGNGVNTAFSYSFKIIESTDLHLIRVAADGTETEVTSDYYVDMAASKVYYPGYAPGVEEAEADQPQVLQTGEKLVVYRNVPITQQDDMPDQWPFDVIESALDKSCIIDQQLKGDIDRALKFSRAVGSNFNPTFPIVAGKTIRIKNDGSGFETTDDPAVVRTEVVALKNETVTAKNAAEAAQANAEAAASTAATTAVTNVQSQLAQNLADTNAAKTAAQTASSSAQSALSSAQNAASVAEAKATVATNAVSSLPSNWQTTVDNAALVKLKTDNWVTPEMYGAVGNGVADDTVAIQQALDSAYSTIVFNGEYKVTVNESRLKALTIPSNKLLLLGKSKIVLATNSMPSCHLFYSNQKSNVTIIGGCIRGDKDTYSLDNSEEHCHGIFFDGGTNIVIRDTVIEYFRGDGIYLGNYLVSNAIVDNCICNENGRNGLSLSNGKNIKIINSHFSNTNKTPPMYGIDLEPNANANQILDNIIIDSCSFANNSYGAISVLSREDNDKVIISNCICDGCIGTTAAGNNTTINVNNCHIKPLAAVETNVHPQWDYAVGFALTAACGENSNILVSNITVDATRNPTSIIRYGESIISNSKNITMKNIVVSKGSSKYIALNRSTACDNCYTEYYVNKLFSLSSNDFFVKGDTSNGNIACPHFTVNATSNVVYGCANEIHLSGLSSYGNINYWYPLHNVEVIFVNDDTVSHGIIGQTFVNLNGEETNRVTLDVGKLAKFVYNKTTNKCYYRML